jgi:hypothetical protein
MTQFMVTWPTSQESGPPAFPREWVLFASLK